MPTGCASTTRHTGTEDTAPDSYGRLQSRIFGNGPPSLTERTPAWRMKAFGL